jgi:ArsR family transcriptional regulator, arsenate/arsenite/antimonite-responsive transcriptional repressor
MDIDQAATGFSAIGSEPRLVVLLALVKAGPQGLTIGEIQQRAGQPPSTLAHHLRALTAAGLVVQEKRGRNIVNHAAFDHIEILAHYLLRECCSEAVRAHKSHEKLCHSDSKAKAE